MSANLDALDPTFVTDLLASQEAVQLVARWLERQGFRDVRVPEVQVRPDPTVRAQYADGGDLFYREQVEVKQRHNVDFTCAADYPYPEGVFVDKCYKIDRARPLPIVFAIVNRAGTHMALIPRDSRRNWRRVERFWGGRTQAVYVAPLECVTFVRLEGV